MIRSIKELVKNECANYDDGLCLIKGSACSQTTADIPICRYYYDCVFPLGTQAYLMGNKKGA